MMTDAALNEALQITSLSKNWKAFLWRGLIACLFAVLAWLMPEGAVLALTIVFGAFSFVDGVFALWSGYKNMRRGESWGWLIFGGVLGIATGLIVLVAPLLATIVLATFLWASIAFWSAFSGIAEIVTAIRLRKEIEGEIWLVLSGLVSVALSMAVTWMLLTRPVESFLALGWLLSFYAAFFGVMMVLLSLRLRKANISNGPTASDNMNKDGDA